MPHISVFSGAFCGGESVVREVFDRTGGELLTDRNLVALAAARSGMRAEALERAFSARTSIFNKFNHEKERALAFLRLALAERLQSGRLLLSGFLGHLVPVEVGDILRVCLIGEVRYRVAAAAREQGLGEEQALRAIGRLDGDAAGWVKNLREAEDPWDPLLYDIVIPMDKTGVKEAAALIEHQLATAALQPGAASARAAADFLLAAQVEVALASAGHSVGVQARDGAVTLTINQHVLLLGRLEEELKAIAGRVPGVAAVNTRVGKGYYQADVYRQFDFQAPSRVLLVDDERQFVQTLSERLQMRDVGSAVAYDGESALRMVVEDEPEVMLLDLKMPGIDGIEVLRQVKAKRPDVEVIILTGHGSDVDRETCMRLGAFAYLNKPVDIEVLSATLRAANEKIRRRAAARAAGDGA